MSSLLLVCIATSISAALLLVPIVRSLARFFGIVDQPDQTRKLHRDSIALGGGVAVFAAMALAVGSTLLYDRHFGADVLSFPSKWYVLFAAATAMLLIGLIDDKFALRGRQKLLLQCLTVVLLVGNGTLVEEISLFGMKLDLGIFGFPLTVLWLLITVNALNLIDGADGVATTAGCIICAGLGFLGIRHGVTVEGIAAFALAGSLAGFLVFNKPPASIFLGDAGSMMIGLFVGVFAVWSNLKETTILASAPVAIFAIPLFDSSAAILRRWLTGRSIYIADRAHVHHLLQARYGAGRMLLIVAVLCATTTSLAVASTLYDRPWLSALGVCIVMTLLVLTRSFGHAECRLLVTRASQFARSFASLPAADGSDNLDRRVSLQGTGQWEMIWEPLVEFAKSHDLNQVKIDLNLAWIHEGYHATWRSVRMPEKQLQLNVRMPLFTCRGEDQPQACIGSLEIIAAADDPSVYDRISDLSEKLVDLCPQIDAIVQGLERIEQGGHIRGGNALDARQPVEPAALARSKAHEFDSEPVHSPS